ncbi:hypothetical protein FE633_13175 [Streptomyces montanus]|uniref:Bacteriophage T5 Orf172 DNA-binding domain-containing protein n=1 Tax=Streptomyces montanus TaxID=2580423 RepID=A0A5R9FYY1_9ACTN|nr:GIY-YIG nuclease family protein [Streptomyces montanus]TLS45714.1 hypothetical protein FE633_13175 [Streptomyces montanus]
MPENPDRWVYLIGSSRARVVKIGVSNDPEARLQELQTGSPVALRVLWKKPGGQPLESARHMYFGTCRAHGEWFDFGEHDPVALVQAAAATLGYHGPATEPETREPTRNTDRLVLDAIKAMPAPARKKEVARAVRMTRGTVSKAVGRLVDGGFLAREADGSFNSAGSGKEVR